MPKYTVAYTETIFPDVKVEQAILEKVGARIVVGACKTGADVIRLAADADALATFTFKPIDETVMAGLPKCKMIVRGGIGVDTIDVPAATRQGIMVVNIPDYCLDEVSDLAITLMLALLRKIPVALKSTGRGEWNRELVKPLQSLRRLTVGVVGFGNIGRRSAQKAAAFGMNIVFFDPFVSGDVKLGRIRARKVELNDLLEQADVILLHAPATEKTYHLINRDTLARVKPGCVLVNAARGQLVDTPALVDALKAGRLGGAGLDLIEGVPPLGADHPLLKCDNVIVTPYYAWYTEDSVRAMRETMATEIVRVLRGRYPHSLVNKDVKAAARVGSGLRD